MSVPDDEWPDGLEPAGDDTPAGAQPSPFSSLETPLEVDRDDSRTLYLKRASDGDLFLVNDDDGLDGPPGGLENPELKNYDGREQHDTARRRIAYTLIGLLCGIVVAAFLSFWGLTLFRIDQGTEHLKILLEQLLPPIIPLVSAATGFYFGSKSRSD